LRVIGYTDAKGGEVQNTPLSLARAEKVAGELVARGIDASRLVAVGRNDVRNLSPLIGEKSPNRRVEFEIPFEGEAVR
jgi:outer membrane protein OmpA-like peptidoglycan-associated protein